MNTSLSQLKHWIHSSSSIDKTSLIGAINDFITDNALKNLLKLTVRSDVFLTILNNKTRNKDFLKLQFQKLVETNLWSDDVAQKSINVCLELLRMEDVSLFKIKRNSLWGFMNISGKVMIEPRWPTISNFSNNRAYYKADIDTFVIIDELGEKIMSVKASFIYPFQAGIAIINRGGQIINKKIVGGMFGVIDIFGDELIPCLYEAIYKFSHLGLAIVKNNNLFGLINNNGEIILDCVYDSILPAHNEVIAVKRKDSWGYINRHGQIIIDFQFDAARQFENHLSSVKLNNKWAFIDKLGKLVTEFKYDYVGTFKNGFAWVNIGGRIVNKSIADGKWGFVNEKGDETTPLIFDWLSPFNCGLAAVREGNKLFYIDYDGNHSIIPKNAIGISAFSEGVAWVKKKRGYFLINIDGEHIIDDEDFVRVTPFKNGLAIIESRYQTTEWQEYDDGFGYEYETTKTMYSLIDKENIHQCFSEDGIEELDNNFYKIKKSENIGNNSAIIKYTLYHNGKEIIPNRQECDMIYRPKNGLILIERDFEYSYIDYDGVSVGPVWVEEKEKNSYYNWLDEFNNSNDD